MEYVLCSGVDIVRGSTYCYSVCSVHPAILFKALVEIESRLPCFDIYDEDCMCSKFNTGN